MEVGDKELLEWVDTDSIKLFVSDTELFGEIIESAPTADVLQYISLKDIKTYIEGAKT